MQLRGGERERRKKRKERQRKKGAQCFAKPLRKQTTTAMKGGRQREVMGLQGTLTSPFLFLGPAVAYVCWEIHTHTYTQSQRPVCVNTPLRQSICQSADSDKMVKLCWLT